MKYRHKYVEAVQWFKNGDHPKDNPMRPFEDTGKIPEHPREGEVVRYYRNPTVKDTEKCEKCGQIMHVHGWIDGGYNTSNIVCPGDFVVEMPYGYWAMKPADFHKTFEPVTD